MTMSSTAVITGASFGIGYELAKLFARDGINLVLTARSQDKLKATQQALANQFNIKVFIYSGDLSHPSFIEDLVQYIQDQELTVDYLVNNAGFGMMGAFSEVEWRQDATMIDLNVRALTHLTKLLLPSMIANGKGRVLNVASQAAFQAGPLMSVYYATKHYVLAFSEGLAEEVADKGITVTAFCPGPVETDFKDHAGMDKSLLFRLPFVKKPDEVAAYAYKKMQKGKRIAIPGLYNQFSVFMVRFLPRKLAARLAKSLH